MSRLPLQWPPQPSRSKSLFCKSVLIAWSPLLLIVLVAFLTWFYGFRPIQMHREWYRKVEHRILMLSDKRPVSVSQEDWAKCIHWTWNLHSNFGPPSYFNPDVRESFLADFDQRLAGSVDLKTIDWIWDQYLIHAPKSKSYAHYRPTTSEARATLTSESLESFVEQLRIRDRETD